MSTKLKIGDMVVLVSGKKELRGKTGKIMSFNKDKSRVFVQGLNMVKEFVKPNPQKNIQGGILEREGSIAIAKVMYYDTEAEEGTRIGYKLENDKKVRYSKKTGKVID